jgi:hypothetical protein
MEKRIIYKNEDGSVAVIIPSPDCGLTVDEIALKDVPYGRPFKIVDLSDLPADRTQRDAWLVAEEDLTDGLGANYGVGSENPFEFQEPKQ